MTTSTDEVAFLTAICANPDDDTARLVYADWLDEHEATVERPCPSCAEYAADPANPWPGQPGYRPERDPASGRHESGWANCKACNASGSGRPGWVTVSNGRAARAEFIRVQCRIAQIQKTCSCGACVKLRAGGQHTNGRCATDERQDDGVCLRRREYEIWQGYLPTPNWNLPHLGGRAWYVTPQTATAATPPFAILRRGFINEIHCTAADWLAHGDAIRAQHPVTAVTLTTWPEHMSQFNRERYHLFLEDRWSGITFGLPDLLA